MGTTVHMFAQPFFIARRYDIAVNARPSHGHASGCGHPASPEPTVYLGSNVHFPGPTVATRTTRTTRASCQAENRPILPVPEADIGGKAPNKSWNASSLAFLGDSVWELYARRRCFHPPKSAAKYREAVIKMVRAESQSEACAKLSASGILTEAEAEVLRWGKNAPGTLPKRLERAVYRDATGLEALVGYLYMSGHHDRLNTIMEYLDLL